MSHASSPATESACVVDHCITCSDAGVPMSVLRCDERRGLALCADHDGAHHTVETALVEPVAPGEIVLVHAGVAIAALAPATDGEIDPATVGEVAA